MRAAIAGYEGATRYVSSLQPTVDQSLGRDLPFAYVGMRMAELMSPLDHGKAQRELGWTPEPVEDSIRRAAVFFASRS
jgi:dihydroflavonol-4-reductase